MRISWRTDIHLNSFGNQDEALLSFVESVRAEKTEALLLTGDISEAGTVIDLLKAIARLLGLPVYFVFGNHDFYNGWIDSIREAAGMLGDGSSSLKYLKHLAYLTTQNLPIRLSEDVCLIGHDGWADARIGNFESTKVEIKDHRRICNFIGLLKKDRLKKLNSLGDEAAENVREKLMIALIEYRHVILATHIPPFREACIYHSVDGTSSPNEDWLPHMTCKAVGDVILDVMKLVPERKLTVYCGHTHTEAVYQPLPNVTVHVGGAKLRVLQAQLVIEV